MKVFDKTLVLTVLIFLAVGMGSAAVLSSYGVISGTADVEGPTFYVANIDSEDILKVNEPPTEEEGFAQRKVGPDYSSEFFVSPDLETGSWYEMEVEMFVKARTVEGTDQGNIHATFLYDKPGEEDIQICSTDISVNSENYQQFGDSCESKSDSGIEVNDVERFTYKLEGGRNDAFEIKPDGITRVEVNVQ